jgi:hypothetical protein
MKKIIFLVVSCIILSATSVRSNNQLADLISKVNTTLRC